MVQIAVLEYKKEQGMEDNNNAPVFFYADIRAFQKTADFCSRMTSSNWHSTAFSVFMFWWFFVIIWIAPLSWYFVEIAIHIIPDSGAILLSIHQENAGFCLILQAFPHIFDMGSLRKVILLEKYQTGIVRRSTKMRLDAVPYKN